MRSIAGLFCIGVITDGMIGGLLGMPCFGMSCLEEFISPDLDPESASLPSIPLTLILASSRPIKVDCVLVNNAYRFSIKKDFISYAK
jgi:hypothetical protein